MQRLGHRWWSVLHPRADSSVIPTPDAEARYVRLLMLPRELTKPIGIREVRIKASEFSASPNALFTALAADAPRGRYPRYFSNEQSYWTVIGVDGDDAEALINEEGAVELSKRGPTLEPFISTNGQLLTWAEAEHTQSLESGYLPIPSVVRLHEQQGLELTITALADGEPGSPLLWITYRLKNLQPDAAASSASPKRGTLHIALRPFQVNPPWQRLNNEGGFARITDISPTSLRGHAALTFKRLVVCHGRQSHQSISIRDRPLRVRRCHRVACLWSPT